MYSTFGAPSGARGGSNGDQSGTESRISMLIVPLKGSLIPHSSGVVLPTVARPGGPGITRSGWCGPLAGALG